MADAPAAARERLLDPVSRISEILFGLIMALTFTGTISVVTAGREDVRTLLVGAVGCNIAWGLVDAMMFLIATLTERGRDLLTLRSVQNAPNAAAAHGVIAEGLPPQLASVLSSTELEQLRQGVLRIGSVAARPRLTSMDWLRALAVFLLVVLSTFPVVIPFLVFQNVQIALRTSNLIAIAMLFVAGYMLARHGGYHPLVTGGIMVALGVTLVGIAIALGG